jgi:hypothetical protein
VCRTSEMTHVIKNFGTDFNTLLRKDGKILRHYQIEEGGLKKLGTVTILHLRTAVAQWLRYCATNQKVSGSIPDGVIGNFQ